MNDKNSSLETQLIDYFISLSEADFTLKVLQPLFENMGYHPVIYHGGRDEGGKDLICWKDDDFGDKNLTVVQIKKTTASASASTRNSFAGIVSQLQQAKEKKVVSLDGVRRIPDSVLFITPYRIDTRALESRFEGYQLQRPLGVKVYDGNYIATQKIKGARLTLSSTLRIIIPTFPAPLHAR